MEIPPLLESMLRGERGQAKEMGARLVLDMADTAGAESLIPAVHAHVSGVSVITGGPGFAALSFRNSEYRRPSKYSNNTELSRV